MRRELNRMICSNCGNTIKDESKFCQYCGTAVPAPQTAEAPAPADAAADVSVVYTPPAADGQPADAENAAPATYKVVEESQPQPPAYQPPAPPYYTGKPQASAPVPPAGAHQPAPPVPPYAAAPKQDSSRKGFAIASLVLSLIGVLFAFSCCLAFVGTLCCILGVIFGAVAMKNPANKALAISGLVIGIVGFVLSIVIGIIFIADIGTAGDLFEDFYYNYDYWTY